MTEQKNYTTDTHNNIHCIVEGQRLPIKQLVTVLLQKQNWKDKAVLLLLQRNYSYRSVGKRLRVSVGYVNKTVLRAREKLQWLVRCWLYTGKVPIDRQ